MRFIFTVGVNTLVVSQEFAVAVMSAMGKEGFERYEERYVNGAMEPRVTPVSRDIHIGFSVLPDEKYAMGKMLAAAEEKNQPINNPF
jgi:hypothetical protein